MFPVIPVFFLAVPVLVLNKVIVVMHLSTKYLAEKSEVRAKNEASNPA